MIWVIKKLIPCAGPLWKDNLSKKAKDEQTFLNDKLLFINVMYYKVVMNTELANTKLLLLEEIHD